MQRLFRIDFYPADWLIDTAILTNEERGFYINVISLIYSKRGAIDNNPKWLGGVCNCSARMARTIISSLAEKSFIQLSGSKITQKRAESELNKKRTSLEHSANGGRTKNEKRSETKQNNNLPSSDAVKSPPAPSPTPTPEAIAIVTSKKKKVSKATGSRFALTELPADWKNFCILKRPDLNPEELFYEFRDYWIAVPGQRGLKLDWYATWRNRVRDKKQALPTGQRAMSFKEQDDLKFKQVIEEARKKYVDPS